MAKTMKVREIVDKMSELYRAETKKTSSIYEEYLSVIKTLAEHLESGYENITVAEHERLRMQEIKLKKDRELQESYCDGIFAARELLMSLGFETVVDVDKE